MKGFMYAVLAVASTAGYASAATGDPAVDALIDKLVEKKVITRDDANELEKDLKKPVESRQAEPAKPPGEAAKAQGEAEAAPKKSKLKLPVDVKIRTQARVDTGDLLVGQDGKYQTETDLFLRRVRLEVEKVLKTPPLGEELELNVTLDADRFEQTFRHGRRRTPSNDVNLLYAYGDWTFIEPFGVEVGKHKLPFLRVELTSSSRQLIIERPSITGAAKESFGDYHQPHIMAHGGFAGGAARYYLSYFDGASDLDTLQDLDANATAVQGAPWGRAFMGRIELSPLGLLRGEAFIETKKDDTGIGGENHLTLGFDGGFQQDIKYATASVRDARLSSQLISVDLSGRYTFGGAGTLTGQGEYIHYKRNYNYRRDEKPHGGYIQAGYLLPWPILRGELEPAARYEIFDHDHIDNNGKGGTTERTVSIGWNHYLLKHSIKWSYNFVHTRFDQGVAEALNSRDRDLHQLQLQLYF